MNESTSEKKFFYKDWKFKPGCKHVTFPLKTHSVVFTTALSYASTMISVFLIFLYSFLPVFFFLFCFSKWKIAGSNTNISYFMINWLLAGYCRHLSSHSPQQLFLAFQSLYCTETLLWKLSISGKPSNSGLGGRAKIIQHDNSLTKYTSLDFLLWWCFPNVFTNLFYTHPFLKT